MPIPGLTDREGAFVQIGVIRKGAPKKPNKPGADLDYFRVEFDEGEQAAATEFTRQFGPRPAEIVVLMPFAEPERCLEAWNEAYLAGALIHRCERNPLSGESGRVAYALDYNTGQRLVLNGVSLETGQPVLCTGAPVASYKTQKGKTEQVKCSPVGRLRVIVPALRRLAYLMVLTGSKHDIANLMAQLREIQRLGENHSLLGIPLVLRRRPRAISTPDPETGKPVRRRKSLLSLEADPVWVGAKLRALFESALPEGQQADYALLLPPEEDLPEEEDEGDEELPGAPAVLPEPAPVAPAARGAAPSKPAAVSKPVAGKAATPPRNPGKIAIRDGAGWNSLLGWAGEQGLYEKGDRSAGYRMANVLAAAGWKEFKDGDLPKAQAVIQKHYTEKQPQGAED